MSSDLGEDARALLRMTRHEGLPDAASLQRVRASLLCKVGVAAGVATAAAAASKTTAGATAAAASKAAAGATTATASAASLVAPSIVKGAVAVLVAASVGATAYATRDGWGPVAEETKLSAPRSAIASASSPPATVVRAPSAPPEPAPPPMHAASPTTAPAPLPMRAASSTTAPLPARAASSPATLDRPKARPRPATTSSPAEGAPVGGSDPARSAPSSGVASLAPDLARLREAHRAIAEGKPERAVEAVAAIPDSSPLREERDGVRTIARCALARRTMDESAARAARERFLSSYPGSSLATRVDESCTIRPKR